MTRRYALLAATSEGWFTDCLFACPGIELYSLPKRSLGLEEELNPYKLPPIEKPDGVLVCTYWYQRLQQKGDPAVERVFSRLRALTNIVVGIEGHDPIRLAMPPMGMDRIDLMLKSQGVYRDRELYNYEVGPYYPGANWVEKRTLARDRYSPAQLDKVKLSIPAFLAMDTKVRARVREIKPYLGRFQRYTRALGDWVNSLETLVLDRLIREPAYLAHCLGTLTHIQRLELLVRLKSQGVTGLLGISRIPERIGGTPYFDDVVPEVELAKIRNTAHVHGLSREPQNRYRYRRDMLLHKVVLAPTGYGEMPLRCAEAWQVGRAVVCQDMSHVETLYPFRDRENIIFCKPDFSDIEQILHAVQSGEIDYRRIGRQGRSDWQAWSRRLDEVFAQGVTRHLVSRA